MSRLTVTVFYDPKAKDTKALVERLAIIAPSLHIGVSYVDITGDRDLTKRYEKVAPLGVIAGTIVFSGGFDEQMMRSRLRLMQKRG